jgi:hypothetical protein
VKTKPKPSSSAGDKEMQWFEKPKQGPEGKAETEKGGEEAEQG